jgi:uncharacterized YkwD family protein/spore coat assembly protein SafA
MKGHIVMKGDTMWSIARKYGGTINDLLAANPQITDPSLIFPGQVINIPIASASVYIVVAGDTMAQIARKHGISLNDLLAANPQISNPSLIFPGQRINIPDKISVTNNIRTLEQEVIRLVNNERVKRGLSALTPNNEISQLTRIKSEDFITNNYFSHTSPTYGSPFDMLRSSGIRFTAAGENIAKGQRTASEVMNFWMNSSGHRANILNSNYNQIGVGVARDRDGTIYWTQIFIRS